MKLRKIALSLLLIVSMMVAMTGSALAETVTTWSELKSALENGGDVVLGADIQETTGANITIDGKTATLDLNGHKIEGSDNNASGNFGLINITNGANLTVKDTVGGGMITLKAATERNWSALSAVLNNVCGTLIVESGHFEHLGGTAMAYVIDNNSNGKAATLTVNDGELVSTYRAVRMFVNSTTALNKVTINGGTLQGGNSGIWLQNPSGSNAALAELTINDGDVIGTSNSAVLISAGPKGDLITTNITGGSFESEGTSVKATGDSATSSIEVTGGSYSDTSAQDYVPADQLIIKLEGDSTPYKIGEEAEEALTEEDSTITIVQAGSDDLTVGEGTTVINDTDSNVSINGSALAAGQSVTIPKPTATPTTAPTATPAPNAGASAPAAPTATPAPAPKTGDNTNLVALSLLMAAAFIGIVVLSKKRAHN